MPKRLRRYIGDVPYTFTDTEATELGIIGQYINPIFDDLTAQKYSAPLRNLPYLTNKKIELDIINQEPRRKRTGYDVMQRAQCQSVSCVGFAIVFPWLATYFSTVFQFPRSDTVF